MMLFLYHFKHGFKQKIAAGSVTKFWNVHRTAQKSRNFDKASFTSSLLLQNCNQQWFGSQAHNEASILMQKQQ